MFRTIVNPSSGATFYKLYSAGTSGCCMAIAIQQPDVTACTNCAVQLIKRCSWWWTNDSPKHVEPFNEKIKIIHKNLCISLVYIHIAIWCIVHTTSKSKISFRQPNISSVNVDIVVIQLKKTWKQHGWQICNMASLPWKTAETFFNFLFSRTATAALGPIQPHTQCASGFYSRMKAAGSWSWPLTST